MKRRMKWSEDQILQACELYESGLPVSTVAIRVHIPERTIYKYLEENGIARRPMSFYPTHEWTEESRRKVSEANRKRICSNETREKMSKAKRCNYNGLNGYGHTKKHPNGYVLVYCPMHPHAHNDGYIGFHRVIVERELGRYLTEDEVVHHINHIRDDNRPENLMLMDKTEHCAMHMKERYQKKEN